MDETDLIKMILRHAVRALAATNGYLALFGADGSVKDAFYCPSALQPWNLGADHPPCVTEALRTHVVQNRQSVLIQDTRTNSLWQVRPNDPIRSVIARPLLGHEGVLGLLILGHIRPGYFNEDHMALLRLIASQACMAIENAQLYRQIQVADQHHIHT